MYVAGPSSCGPTTIDQTPMVRQASAQRRHASAHCLQCSMSCAAHCLAHQSQTFAHSAQITSWNGLLRAMASAHSLHSTAHSMQQAGQSFGLSLPTICEKQLPHAVAQVSQAVMHALMASVRWWLVMISSSVSHERIFPLGASVSAPIQLPLLAHCPAGSDHALGPWVANTRDDPSRSINTTS